MVHSDSMSETAGERRFGLRLALTAIVGVPVLLLLCSWLASAAPPPRAVRLPTRSPAALSEDEILKQQLRSERLFDAPPQPASPGRYAEVAGWLRQHQAKLAAVVADAMEDDVLTAAEHAIIERAARNLTIEYWRDDIQEQLRQQREGT
jgi:hypothetical protein